MEKAWFKADGKWHACTVHGYTSQVMPQPDTAATATAVAVVEDDESGAVLTVEVGKLSFREPDTLADK